MLRPISISIVPFSGSRFNRDGVRGGGVRRAFACFLMRGRMQPISEMNSSR